MVDLVWLVVCWFVVPLICRLVCCFLNLLVGLLVGWLICFGLCGWLVCFGLVWFGLVPVGGWLVG